MSRGLTISAHFPFALPLAALALALAGFAPAHAARPETSHTAPAKHKAKPANEDEQDHGNNDDPAVLATETDHVVKKGETLGGIAHRAHVPRILIAEANRLKRPYHVHAGQKLQLPRTRHHTVKKGESGFDIAYQYGVPFSAIAIANALDKDAVLTPGQKLLIPTMLHPSADTAAGNPATAKADDTPPAKAKSPAKADDADDKPVKFIWPVAGNVRRGFAPRDAKNYHDGIDIIAQPGTAVRAAAAGKVLFAGDEPQSFGRLVVIDHGGGWQSAYGFLGRMTVAKGDTVKARERIGLVGHSGRATADDLHFELRRANKPVDPAELLPVKAKVAEKAAVEEKPKVKAKAKKKPKPKDD